jgi:hypothetical protein
VLSNTANSGDADDPTASSHEPAWPDPSKASRGHNPYEPRPGAPSGPPTYGYPPLQAPYGPVPSRPGTSVAVLVGAVVLALIAFVAGLAIGYLLWA